MLCNTVVLLVVYLASYLLDRFLHYTAGTLSDQSIISGAVGLCSVSSSLNLFCVVGSESCSDTGFLSWPPDSGQVWDAPSLVLDGYLGFLTTSIFKNAESVVSALCCNWNHPPPVFHVYLVPM